MVDASKTLRIGTRGSLLARAQSEAVAVELRWAHPGMRVELVAITTTADRVLDRPLYDLGGKGLFTKEIEQALLAGQIDLAVHSFKDVPVTMPLVDQSELIIAAVPKREDPRDVLVSTRAHRLGELAAGAKIGTGSPRRRCQILAQRPDLRIEPLRGNIDTRIRKLREGQFDAIVLALAGLRRGGLWDEKSMHVMELDDMLPAPAQGALALQCRRDDQRARELVGDLNDTGTAACVAAERDVVGALQADCHSPVAALGLIQAGRFELRALVGARDGDPPVIRAHAHAPPGDAHRAVDSVVRQLLDGGAQSLLQGGR